MRTFYKRGRIFKSGKEAVQWMASGEPWFIKTSRRWAGPYLGVDSGLLHNWGPGFYARAIAAGKAPGDWIQTHASPKPPQFKDTP